MPTASFSHRFIEVANNAGFTPRAAIPIEEPRMFRALPSDMFRKEDTTDWIVFSVGFVLLIMFDNLVLFRANKVVTCLTAALYTTFWVAMATLFGVYVYFSRGADASLTWASGYLLEWMLSFDNLFVFYLVFQIYRTPNHLKHKPLFWGICGAIVFRLIFIFIGEFVMHGLWVAHVLCGIFLIYTGVMSALVDEGDEDGPSDNAIVRCLASTVPFIPLYDSKGGFFVRVPVDARGKAILPEKDEGKHVRGGASSSRVDEEAHFLDGDAWIQSSTSEQESSDGYGTTDSTARQKKPDATGLRATMLFLVVCCLEVSDIIFAIDSTSAVVAQVPDFFLAYTSVVFAMLGLRGMFFILDALIKMVALLKYGVALALIFIGVKSLLADNIPIPPLVICGVLFGILGVTIVLSVVKNVMYPDIENATPKEAE
eukprot:GEMP01037218.1.p1 GENE.GEMP01037218.1~~GEMP01037218.1.p1  ORF type:complete len:427 (+),score=95.85 GEMP01037218.1:262-1542(+)